MPELPEVETIARGLRPHVEGAVIERVRVERRDYVRCPGRSAGAHLAGRRVEAVRRHGKRLALVLRPSGSVVVHLGMSGRIELGPMEAPLAKHTHFRLSFRDREIEMRVLDPRRFGGVCVAPARDVTADDLGPDALALRLPAFRRILSRPRQIKALLLDQRAIAGLGNIYTDEALFAAGIHPLARADRLRADEARLLLAAIRRVLGAAIRHRGSTIRDYRDADGRGGGFQARHKVYGRAGEPCPRCAGRIVRIVAAGRSTHLCPRCQPRSTSRRSRRSPPSA
jgi:formamidopyrimidine-DNA glycosylase